MNTLNRISRKLRTLRYISPQQVFARADYKLRCIYFNSPLPSILQAPPEPATKLNFNPPLANQGNKKIGAMLTKNTFEFLGRTLTFDGKVRWYPGEVSALWLYHLHYFEWLSHLKGLGKEGEKAAQLFIEDWLSNCQHWNKFVWHPYVLSRRIISWINYGTWLTHNANPNLQIDFFNSLTQQVEHLRHILEWDIGSNHLIKNLKALIYAGLVLPDRQDVYLEAINLLTTEINKQILDDGAHYVRSPYYHAQILKDFLDIHALILKAGQTPPAHLGHAIDQMAEVLAFFRHGDGALALFNDGDIDHPKELSNIIKRCGGVAKIPHELPNAGYVRLHKNKSLLIANVGPCCADSLTSHAHANTLAFEFSVGATRLFVNSGTYAFHCPQRNKFRGTKSQNTVCVDNTDSAEVWGIFNLGRRPQIVTYEMVSEKGTGSGFIATHNGYKQLKTQHTRRIFLSEDGKDLRGEDTISSHKKRHVTATFHLHPSTTCKLKSATEALLTTQDRSTYLFRLAGGRLHTEKSQYSPHLGQRQQNITLIATGKWEKDKCVLKWALQQT